MKLAIMAAIGVAIGATSASVPARAEKVLDVWQDWSGKRVCNGKTRCEIFFSAVTNAQKITGVSCIIENSVISLPNTVILGVGDISQVTFKDKWEQDGVYFSGTTMAGGNRYNAIVQTLYVVKAGKKPAVRVDYGFEGDIEFYCSISGPNNQP